ncbi:MAG: pilus assembly protein N-terminal domain-containing protein [Planctomycetaceae bacterium]|nr:pilus assembly protein N-terminal domain-containing protein [Planctomycetaceae bacterium]
MLTTKKRWGRSAWLSLLASLMLAGGPAMTSAQPPAGEPELRANENIYEVLTPTSELTITEQFARIFQCANKITRVDGFDPDVISVDALSPYRLRVHGEKSGVTTLVITDEYDNSYSIEVFIAGDVRHLEAYLRQLFPEASVTAVKIKDSIVLKGVVTEPDHIQEIMDVAKEFYPNVLNHMRVGGVHQVLLDVRVMEVARTKVRQLGFNFLLNGNHTFVASTPGAVTGLSSVTTPPGGPSVASFTGLDAAIQFAVMGSTEVFNGFVDALRNESLLKILAEPRLVTTSGRPATILSGGEFPILVPQSLGTVSIQWREFGVRMEAVPVVLGNDRLRLDVAPEVSERDFSNAVTVQGMVVPGITTRRVNTQVEMRFGETLMIGGLISTRSTSEATKLPFLGELPLVGAAFRAVNHSMSETELLILVTPHMVAPMSPEQTPCVAPGGFTDNPTDRELFIDGMIEVPFYGDACEGCQLNGGYGSGAAFGGAYGNGEYGQCGPNEYVPLQMQGYPSGGMIGPDSDHEMMSQPPLPSNSMPQPTMRPDAMPATPMTNPTFQNDGSSQFTNPTSMQSLPALPPLPGHVNTSARNPSGANQPANLGLIDPFRGPIQQGEVPVQVETSPIRLTSGVAKR